MEILKTGFTYNYWPEVITKRFEQLACIVICLDVLDNGIMLSPLVEQYFPVQILKVVIIVLLQEALSSG